MKTRRVRSLWATLRWQYAGVTALVAPLAVTMAPRDSALLRLQAAGSTADFAYVTRGCNGEIISASQRSFREAGGAADVHVTGPVHGGVRVTHLAPAPGRDIQGVNLWNPYLASEWHNFGLGFGAVSTPERLDSFDSFDILPVSGHLRFGSRQGFHFLIEEGEGVPLYATGLVDLGFGFRPMKSGDFFVGIGTPVPYDGVGFLARADLYFGSHLGIQARGRYGGSAGVAERAIAIGLSYDLLHRRRAEENAVPPLPPVAETDTSRRDSS